GDPGTVEHAAKLAALAAFIGGVGPLPEPRTAGGRVVPVEVLEVVRPAPPRPDSPPPPPEFVVTYARPDAEYGTRLVDWLTRSGLPAWSIADLTWGSRWVHEIRQRLRQGLAGWVGTFPARGGPADGAGETLGG